MSFRGEILVTFDVVRAVGIDGPDSSVVVGRTGCEVADVGREENSGDVGGVGLERSYWDEGGYVAVLEHAPDVNVALGIEGGGKG